MSDKTSKYLIRAYTRIREDRGPEFEGNTPTKLKYSMMDVMVSPQVHPSVDVPLTKAKNWAYEYTSKRMYFEHDYKGPVVGRVDKAFLSNNKKHTKPYSTQKKDCYGENPIKFHAMLGLVDLKCKHMKDIMKYFRVISEEELDVSVGYGIEWEVDPGDEVYTENNCCFDLGKTMIYAKDFYPIEISVCGRGRGAVAGANILHKFSRPLPNDLADDVHDEEERFFLSGLGPNMRKIYTRIKKSKNKVGLKIFKTLRKTLKFVVKRTVSSNVRKLSSRALSKIFTKKNNNMSNVEENNQTVNPEGPFAEGEKILNSIEEEEKKKEDDSGDIKMKEKNEEESPATTGGGDGDFCVDNEYKKLLENPRFNSYQTRHRLKDVSDAQLGRFWRVEQFKKEEKYMEKSGEEFDKQTLPTIRVNAQHLNMSLDDRDEKKLKNIFTDPQYKSISGYLKTEFRAFGSLIKDQEEKKLSKEVASPARPSPTQKKKTSMAGTNRRRFEDMSKKKKVNALLKSKVTMSKRNVSSTQPLSGETQDYVKDFMGNVSMFNPSVNNMLRKLHGEGGSSEGEYS
jgi:hypothetical protein